MYQEGNQSVKVVITNEIFNVEMAETDDEALKTLNKLERSRKELSRMPERYHESDINMIGILSSSYVNAHPN